jgi:hypothetical protein
MMLLLLLMVLMVASKEVGHDEMRIGDGFEELWSEAVSGGLGALFGLRLENNRDNRIIIDL